MLFVLNMASYFPDFDEKVIPLSDQYILPRRGRHARAGAEHITKANIPRAHHPAYITTCRTLLIEGPDRRGQSVIYPKKGIDRRMLIASPVYYYFILAVAAHLILTRRTVPMSAPMSTVFSSKLDIGFEPAKLFFKNTCHIRQCTHNVQGLDCK